MERISFRVKFLKVEITLIDSACQLAGKVGTCLLKTLFCWKWKNMEKLRQMSILSHTFSKKMN